MMEKDVEMRKGGDKRNFQGIFTRNQSALP